MSGGTSQFGVGGGISMMGMGPVYPAESPDNGGGGEYSLPNLRPVSIGIDIFTLLSCSCLLYTSPSPRDRQKSRMPSSA